MANASFKGLRKNEIRYKFQMSTNVESLLRQPYGRTKGYTQFKANLLSGGESSAGGCTNGG